MTKPSVDERQALAAEQASMWLEALERTLKPEEIAAFRQWLKMSMNREAIVARCKLWHGPEVLAVLSELIPVEKLSTRIERNYGNMVLVLFLCVTGLGLTTALIALSERLPGSDARGNPLRAETSYETPADSRKTIELPDGGEIALNTSTRVLLSYRPRFREVTLLRGEASFEVIHDSKRPFRIFVSGRWFEPQTDRARFNLRRVSGDNVELAVLRGQVMAHASGRREPMTPALIRARVTSGDHTFVASEGGLLGPGWQSARMMEKDELQQAIAWQATASPAQAR